MLSFLSRGARTFGLPAPLTPPDSARCGARFRRHWGTITASGTRFRYCPKSAPLPSGILPHIAAECCPTSNGISAPLRPESAARSENDDENLAGMILDMKMLAELPKDGLIASLRQIETAYGIWINAEQA